MPLISLASIPQQDIDPATSYGASRYLTQDTLDTLMRADAEGAASNDLSSLAGGGK
jgi:hypothetical protein